METFMGQIIITAFNFAPNGFAMCNGQTLPIAQFQALFALLGTTYGGDGKRTFNLPNLNKTSNLPTGCNYCIALSGVFPPRS